MITDLDDIVVIRPLAQIWDLLNNPMSTIEICELSSNLIQSLTSKLEARLLSLMTITHILIIQSPMIMIALPHLLVLPEDIYIGGTK